MKKKLIIVVELSQDSKRDYAGAISLAQRYIRKGFSDLVNALIWQEITAKAGDAEIISYAIFDDRSYYNPLLKEVGGAIIMNDKKRRESLMEFIKNKHKGDTIHFVAIPGRSRIVGVKQISMATAIAMVKEEIRDEE